MFTRIRFEWLNDMFTRNLQPFNKNIQPRATCLQLFEWAIQKIMMKQRVIPSDFDVKTDLHRLSLLLEKKNICCSSIFRLKERYVVTLWNLCFYVVYLSLTVCFYHAGTVLEIPFIFNFFVKLYEENPFSDFIPTMKTK